MFIEFNNSVYNMDKFSRLSLEAVENRIVLWDKSSPADYVLFGTGGSSEDIFAVYNFFKSSLSPVQYIPV